MTTADDETSVTIIKSDRTGRQRYTQQYKEQVLSAFDSSGMSGPAFAEHCGLKYPTFASWVAKRRGQDRELEAQPRDSKFVLAEFASSTPSSGIAIELRGGATARLVKTDEVELLAALIKALA